MESFRTIRILPPHLQNQIAAGEVVERPSSVVKELVENSLDAGADRVQVHLEGGGLGLILVQDNGRGMDPAEMRLALTRHATSKLTAVEDLESIATFGFRGEALPSIASVSRLRLASKSRDCPDAACLEVEFGRMGEEGPAAMAQGTRIEVRDLFGNVPARLKFMKSQSTEVRRCQEVLERMALARLDVGLRFSLGERTALRFVPGQDLAARLAVVWPPAVTQSLTPVEADMHGCRVTGYAGLPHVGQARPDRMLFYVNGRPVQDRVLLRAVREAYKGRMLSREYPVAALFIATGPGEVDVNVHPAKTEVRFRDEKLLFLLVRTAVARALDLGAPSAGMRGVLGEGAPSLKEPEPGPKYATYRDYLAEVGRAEAFGEDASGPGVGGESARTSFGPIPGRTAGRVMREGFGEYGQTSTAGRETEQSARSLPRDGRGLAAQPGMEGFDPNDAPAYLRRNRPGSTQGREQGFVQGGEGVARESGPDPFPGAREGEGGGLYRQQPGQDVAPSFRDSASEPGGQARYGRAAEAPQLKARTRPRSRGGVEYLGQVAGTYLVLRLAGEGLALLDQHAAHERVLFEKMRASHSRGESQPLAIPFEVALHATEQKKITGLWGELTALGFAMETVRPGVVAVRGVPPLLTTGQAKEFLREAVAGKARKMEDLWAVMSCKGAIKAGDALAEDEALALVEAWSQAKDRDFCPHGRPVVVSWDRKELEKLFKRRK